MLSTYLVCVEELLAGVAELTLGVETRLQSGGWRTCQNLGVSKTKSLACATLIFACVMAFQAVGTLPLVEAAWTSSCKSLFG